MFLDKVMVEYNFDMSPFIILHAIKSHIIYFTRYFPTYFLQKFTTLVAHVWKLETFINSIYLYKRDSCPWKQELQSTMSICMSPRKWLIFLNYEPKLTCIQEWMMNWLDYFWGQLDLWTCSHQSSLIKYLNIIAL
jgi:hypothetical protein